MIRLPCLSIWHFLYNLWSIDCSRNQSQKLTVFFFVHFSLILQREWVLSGGAGIMPIHSQRGWSLHGVTTLKSTGVYAALWHWAEPPLAPAQAPESNPFHRSHKVLLTLKIHSSGFIHWSEVARAPKTNRGLRSGISDGQVPGTHHAAMVSYCRPPWW